MRRQTRVDQRSTGIEFRFNEISNDISKQFVAVQPPYPRLLPGGGEAPKKIK